MYCPNPKKDSTVWRWGFPYIGNLDRIIMLCINGSLLDKSPTFVCLYFFFPRLSAIKPREWCGEHIETLVHQNHGSHQHITNTAAIKVVVNTDVEAALWGRQICNCMMLEEAPVSMHVWQYQIDMLPIADSKRDTMRQRKNRKDSIASILSTNRSVELWPVLSGGDLFKTYMWEPIQHLQSRAQHRRDSD